MKRTCNRCKALNNVSGYCNLGYSLKADKHVRGVIVNYKPTEECPKPKTITEYIESNLKIRRKRGKNN